MTSRRLGSMTPSGRYPRYTAPSGDGQTLCVPPWASAQQLLQKNRTEIRAQEGEIGGCSVGVLGENARAAVLASALDGTRAYSDVEVSAEVGCPLVLTGHQPGFVHPGVWLKNFAAARLARDVGGVAIGLVIDCDLCRSTSVRVPTGSVDDPRMENVSFDQTHAFIPYEERRILDQSAWQSFGTRAAKTIAPLVDDPLIRQWWPDVARVREGDKLGTVLSQRRHQLELQWHSLSLQVSQSKICQTEPFRRFVLHLLSEAARFRVDHNQALAEYRREHHLRNLAQPVPDLVEDEPWTETPFWIWSTADPTRRALYVQRFTNELRLTDRAGFTESVPVSSEGDFATAVEALAEWEARGVKLRSRALITTMFARLFLADVFIHGIGGAKYDQVTDDICQRFFGFSPPGFITLTGTLRLPIVHTSVHPDRQQQLRQALRNLRYHPEVEFDGTTLSEQDQRQVADLIEQKRLWVQTAKSSENAAERHRQIVAANEGLAAFSAQRRKQLEQELREAQHRLYAASLLDSREYPFCLFPRDDVRNFFLDFPPSMA